MHNDHVTVSKLFIWIFVSLSLVAYFFYILQLFVLAEDKELRNELHRLPLAPETLRAKSRKAEVEKQLAEVEEAKKIFSRSKVFVKIDG